MKLVLSGYDKQESLAIVEINEKMEHAFLHKKSLSSSTFVIEGNRYLYTYEKKDGITLYSYLVVGDELVEVAKKEIDGTDLTHLTYSAKHKMLFGCSYHEGTVFSIKMMQGTFGSEYHYQKLIADDRLSRAHCVVLNESQTELAVVDIALDEIFLFDIQNDKIEYKDSIFLEKGKGPRHAIYDQDNYIYVMTEYSNEVLVIERSTKKVIQNISTLQDNQNESFGATLFFSKDKSKLYASNRGEDSIAIFEVLTDHSLLYIESMSCGGQHPRHMILSSEGQYIVSCNKEGNNVAIIDILTKEVVCLIPFPQASAAVQIY